MNTQIINKLFILSVIVFGSLILFSSCDNIDEDDYQIPIEVEINKRILLEDYTGVQCTNCPRAAREIDNLKGEYGDSLIVVSIHTGYQSAPLTDDPTKDFRTEAGAAYASQFGVTAFPQGMINRTPYGGRLLLLFNSWGGAIVGLSPSELEIELELETAWNEQTRNLEVNVDVMALESWDEDLYLQVWLTEDNIVAPQIDGSTLVEDYEHKHVFRGVLNDEGTWGDKLNNAKQGQILEKRYTSTLTDYYVPENCHVVAFVYKGSDMSVVQVIEGKLYE